MRPLAGLHLYSTALPPWLDAFVVTVGPLRRPPPPEILGAALVVLVEPQLLSGPTGSRADVTMVTGGWSQSPSEDTAGRG